MSRRHEQEKLGGWKTSVAVFLAFGVFLALFLLPELYPLQSHLAGSEFFEILWSITDWVFATLPVGAIIVVAAFLATALLLIGGVLFFYEQLRRRLA